MKPKASFLVNGETLASSGLDFGGASEKALNGSEPTGTVVIELPFPIHIGWLV